MQGDLDFSAERARHPVLLGRVALLAAIERHISEGASCVLLRGTYGRGKSAVLCKLLERLERQGPVPHHFLRRSRAEWADPEAVAHSLARQILQQPTFRTLAGAATAGFIELLGRVSAEVLVPTRSRLVVVIYGLDEAERRVHEDPLARFVPRYPIEGVTLVCASRPTVDLSQLDAWSPRLLDLDSTAWRASNDRACHAFWRRARKPLALTAERAGDAARHAGGNLLYCVALHDHLAAMEPSVRGETALPAGLRGLLADAWRRAIAAAGDDVLAVRQGLALICAVRRPLALDYIADLAGCRDEAARGRFAAAIAPLVAEPQAEHPASSAVVQLRHDAFRQFVEGQLTAGELAAAHATLSKHLCAWPMKSPEVRAYGLAHGLSHLIAAGDWSGATQLGQNLERLLAQCRELGFELAEADLAFAAERCPEGDQRRRWRDLLHAVRDESHWLRKTPSALPTLLYNRLRTLGWSPDALAALPGMEQHGPAWRLRHPLRAQRGLLRTIARPGIDVNACVLTPDGTRVLAGDTHGNITVWETDTGREAGVLAGHESTITCLAITPDGRLAISGSDDRTVRVWDLATGLTRYVLRGARAPVSCCALVPGRGRIVIGAGRTLRILRLDGRGPATVLRGHRGDVKGCAVTPDGTHIASIADDQTVRVWTLDGKRIGVPLGDRSGIVCAFTPDGMGIISERNNLTITRWDPRSRPRHEVPVTTAEFGRVGLLIGCAMLAGERPVVLSSVQASVWMRDLHTGELYARLADGSASVPPCSISTDGRRAATASSDGMYSEILIWDIEAARQVTTDVPNGRVAHCGVSQDGRSVVTATDEELVAWSTHGGQREVSFANPDGPNHVGGMTPDGRHVVWSDGGNTAWVWSPKRPDESEALEPIDDYVSATAISADGRHVAIGTSTGTVELRRRGRTSGLPLPRPLRGEGQITACRLSARGDRLVTASVDGTVTLWDVTRRRPLHVLRPDARPDAHRGSSITALALAADGKRIAFSATSSDIEVWQESPQRHLKLDGHGGWVNDCALLPDGHVISASQDRTLKLWDLSSGACVDTIYGAAPFTSVSLAGGLICAGDALGNVWMLEPRERRDAPPIGPVRQRHAVLIGISTYDERELRALPNAVNDVHALGHALTSAGFNRVTSLHDGGRHPPTRERVRRALREQALQPDDLLLVHISCHGQRIGGEPYLLMRDSKFPFERQTTLAVAEIVELMESSRARRRVLLVDACGAGLAIGADDAVRVRTGAGSSVAPPPRVRSRGRVPIQRGVFSDDARSDHYVHVLGEGAVTLYSTTATQQAQEVGAYGAFTRSVIDVVSRAATSRTGRLTMTDLILHVTAAMRAGKDKAARQDPTVDARLLGDFIFLERRQKART